MSTSKKTTTSKSKPKPDTTKSAASSTANKESKKGTSSVKRIWFVLGTVCILLLISTVAVLGYEWNYNDAVYPGVTLNGEDISGSSYNELLATIEQLETNLLTDGITYSYEGTSLTIERDENSTPLIDIDAAATAQAIYNRGRATGDTAGNLQDKWDGLINAQEAKLVYTIDELRLEELLVNEFSQFEESPSNAYVEFGEDGSLNIVDHVDGTGFIWADTVSATAELVNQFKPISLELVRTAKTAEVTTTDIMAVETDINAVLALAPINLNFTAEDTEPRTFEVDTTELQTWLAVTKQDGLTFNQDLVDTFLDEVAAEIDQPVQEGRFSLDISTDANGEEQVKLQQFAEGKDGLQMNVAETVSALEESIINDGSNTFELTVEVTTPRATPDNLDDLGVTELLGSGETDFGGSPANRIFNIEKGMDALNGLLLAPGEEFSLLTALGPIDFAHGWLSELVIKGDKLEKEAGGGLCQVGSTVFRSTMNSGLEVTERRNHSWAISYYDYEGQAGVDATIYEPAPDYKFRNDTEHWILLRSIIDYPYVRLETWGTNDGREGSFTVPTNYNYVYPGAAEEVLDESLPPGSRNCVQNAYTGLSASFDYIVQRPDGTEESTTYTSTYRARPARCLVGPPVEESAPSSAEATEGQATDTEETDSTEVPKDTPVESPAESTDTATPDDSPPATTPEEDPTPGTE